VVDKHEPNAVFEDLRLLREPYILLDFELFNEPYGVPYMLDFELLKLEDMILF
jgi:hypothetical protein